MQRSLSVFFVFFVLLSCKRLDDYTLYLREEQLYESDYSEQLIYQRLGSKIKQIVFTEEDSKMIKNLIQNSERYYPFKPLHGFWSIMAVNKNDTVMISLFGKEDQWLQDYKGIFKINKKYYINESSEVWHIIEEYKNKSEYYITKEYQCDTVIEENL